MNLEPSSIGGFFETFPIIVYKKGEIILRAGDTPRGVLFLSKGYVRQYSVSPEGEELTLIIFKPGDFFPIIWALNGSSYSYYLEALTPIEVKCSPREEFLKFVGDHPETFFKLTSTVLTRMGGLMARMEHLVFGNARDKIVSIILLCAERFGEKTSQGVILPLVLTHKQIAALVGLSRETASLELKELEREGYLSSLGKSLMIKNIEKLKSQSLLRQTF